MCASRSALPRRGVLPGARRPRRGASHPAYQTLAAGKPAAPARWVGHLPRTPWQATSRKFGNLPPCFPRPMSRRRFPLSPAAGRSQLQSPGLHPGSAPNRLPSPPTSRSQPSPSSGRPAQPQPSQPPPRGPPQQPPRGPHRPTGTSPVPRGGGRYRASTGKPASSLQQGRSPPTGKPAVASRPQVPLPSPPASRSRGRSVPSSFDQPPPPQAAARTGPSLPTQRPEGPLAVQLARMQDRFSLQGFAPDGFRRDPKVPARLSRSWDVLLSVNGPVPARFGLRWSAFDLSTATRR
jgi:hypothetical protein